MHAKMRNKKQINLGIIFVICLGLLITIFLSLKLGTKEINIRDFLAAFGMGNTNDDFIKSIIYKRIPRTIFAILAGSSLAISGVLMQSVTRNPIADPGILGINTGASLSVVIGLSFLGISSSISHISFAIIGGLVSAIFVYAIAVSGKAGLTPIKLALSGTCVSMALSSFVSFLILPNNNVLDKFRFWQIGSLGAATLSSISTLLPFIILGHLIAIFISSDLNALAMGDEMAVGLGVNVNRIRSLAIIASVLLCSSITAIGGPIGFVGLIVPHFCGLFISKDIRTMTISSSFIGAELLLICDIIGRMLGKPGEIEVKIIKEPGLKGAIRSFIHPEKQIFEAVKDLSFEVPKGQILGFIGANGAGKSTTIKMLTGILKPTSGFCRINGKIPQENRQDYVKDIGVVFGQRTQLWWDLALQETYSVLKEIYDVPDAVFQKRMDFLNDVLDLKEFIKDPVRTLSLGQRMRADIAASLLHNPKVLFLDEPTIGLDVSVKDNIRRAITQINQEEETTILLTTHDLSDIEQLCDRIFMIDKGQEIFDGTVNQLKETFGKMKTLTFELRPGQNHVVSQFVGISDIHVTRKELLLNIQYDSSRYQTADIIQKTLSDFAIRDLKMTDVNIEDIIRRFYRKEL